MSKEDRRVVMGLLRSSGQVLLVHRRADRKWAPDVWDLPGGHIDPGEDPADALVRELDEELGVRIERPTQPPVDTFRVPAEGLEGQIWIIDSWQGEVVNNAIEEHDDIGWFHADNLSSLQLVDRSLFDLVLQALERPS